MKEEPKAPLRYRAKMILGIPFALIIATWLIGTITGIDWTDEFTQMISPSTYQYAPNQNYCVMLGRERYVRKPGQMRQEAPCYMDVQSAENNIKSVVINFMPDYTDQQLAADLPSPQGTYSIWRRKIYNGEVEQTRLFAGSAKDLLQMHAFGDTTRNPGYMAYFIIPGDTAQECGDNVDLSICTKLVLGEVLWW